MNKKIIEQATQLGPLLVNRDYQISTAESCTGGGIAAAITEIAGSSAWFECGIVAYSNRIKEQLLKVPSDLLIEHGAVSEPVVLAMVKGVQQLSGSQVAVAVSGIAGPGGGTENKPVGMVCIGYALGDEYWCDTYRFEGDREAVRLATITQSLGEVIDRLQLL